MTDKKKASDNHFMIETSADMDVMDIQRQLYAIKTFPCVIQVYNTVFTIARRSELGDFQTGLDIGFNLALDKWEAKEPRPKHTSGLNQNTDVPVEAQDVETSTEAHAPGKNTVYAMMYSGRENPERNLAPQECSQIEMLVSELKEKASWPYPGGAQGGLGFTGFGVSFYGTNESLCALQAHFSGFVSVWNEKEKVWNTFYDTAGICGYLMIIMGTTLHKHYKEAQKELSNAINAA
jgi:hypothetical protein